MMTSDDIDLVERKMELLNRLYDGITNDKVNVNVDLSDFSADELRSLYNDLMVFNIIANNDSISDYFSYDEMSEMLNGVFVLKKYNNIEAKKKLESIPRYLRNSINFEYLETTIQDGELYFVKSHDYKRLVNYSAKLKTDAPVLMYNDNDDVTRKKLPYEVLNIFRNMLAHARKIETDNASGRLIIKQDYKTFSCSPMWLRGLSSLWSARHKNLEYDAIKDIISKEYGPNKKSISTQDDIKEILKLTDSKTAYRKDPSHMYKFVLNRLRYYDNYYGMTEEKGNEDFDRKIDIFINIIANNPNHIVGGHEVLNSKILYNIQQIVAEAQHEKMEEQYGEAISENFNFKKANAGLDMAGKKLEDLKVVDDKLQEIAVKAQQKNGKAREFFLYQHRNEISKLRSQRDKLLEECHNFMEEVGNDIKLESHEMELFDKTSITNMPVEVAVNLVAFMGYNRIVSTEFYENILNVDPKTYTKAQRKTINNIDLSNFTFSTKWNRIQTDTLENKIGLLKRIRHATTHGNISYSIPAQIRQNLNYEDIIMVYSCDGENDVKVTGRLGDFYDLFNSDMFRPNPALFQARQPKAGV